MRISCPGFGDLGRGGCRGALGAFFCWVGWCWVDGMCVVLDCVLWWVESDAVCRTPNFAKGLAVIS